MINLAQNSIKIDLPTPTLKPIGFNPILSYIEGYAYNQSGKIIPRAKILIKLKADNKLFYQTDADETGFFTIYSNNLPFFEYYLEITDPIVGTSVKQTTSEFITFNQKYITENNLDLIKSTRSSKPIINKETGKENIILSKSTPIPTPQSTTNKINNQLVVFILVFLFLIVTFALMVFYIVKKRQQI